jgi:hypothetical protein
MVDISAAIAVVGTLILLGLLFAWAAVHSRDLRNVWLVALWGYGIAISMLAIIASQLDAITSSIGFEGLLLLASVGIVMTIIAIIALRWRGQPFLGAFIFIWGVSFAIPVGQARYSASTPPIWIAFTLIVAFAGDICAVVSIVMFVRRYRRQKRLKSN